MLARKYQRIAFSQGDFQAAYKIRTFATLYYLKSDTKISNIYDCIKNIFAEYGLPQNAPKNYSIITDSISLFWDCPNEDDKLVEFCFYGCENGQNNELQLIFNKNVKDSVHELFFRETTEDSNFVYTEILFSAIKKFIPKSYLQTKIIDDKLKIQTAFHEYLTKIKNSNSGDINEAIDKSLYDFLLNVIHPGFNQSIEFSTTENADGTITFSSQVKKSDAEIIISKHKKNICEFPYAIKIEFVADVNGNLFLSKSEIEQLMEDLQFLNATFIASYGVSSILNREILTKNIPNWRENERATKKDIVLRNEFQNFQNEFINGVKNDFAKKFFLEEPSIKIKIGSSEHEILKVATIIESWSGNTRKETYDYSYEKVKNEILDYVTSSEKPLEEWINKVFPELQEKAEEDDRLIQEKMSLYLKKYGVEAGKSLELSKENESLKREINYLNTKNTDLSSKNKRLLSLLQASGQANSNAIENPLCQNIEYQKILQKSSNLESENKELKKELATLRSKIETLEKKNSRGTENENTYIMLRIPCKEGNISENEIEDFLYKLLYSAIAAEKKKLPENKNDEQRRKRDVLESLSREKVFDWADSKTCKKIERIENIFKQTKDFTSVWKKLRDEGIEKYAEDNYIKYWYGKTKYIFSHAKTPEDAYTVVNKIIRDIKFTCFLI